MSASTRRLLFWLPRGLGLLFAGFLSLFALDVLGMAQGFWQVAGLLLLHLVPALALLLALLASWRWPLVGAGAFIGFALWYLVQVIVSAAPPTYMLLAALPLVIGCLFLADWHGRRAPPAA